MLEFVRRDIEEGFRQERSRRMPMALNIIVGAVPGATDRMLKSNCEEDFSEQTAAVALRTPGVDVAVADVIAKRHLDANEVGLAGMLADTFIRGRNGMGASGTWGSDGRSAACQSKNTQPLQSTFDVTVNMTIYSL